MPSADRFLEQAAEYIGYYGDYNRFNHWYWCVLNGMDSDPGWAWCSVFQSYVADDVGLDCVPSASSAAFGNQFPRVEPASADRGDFVLFNWDGRQSVGWTDHIGIVEWFDHDSGYFGTIEGNVDNGYVRRCTRTIYAGYFCAFFRPAWTSDEMPDAWPVWMYESNGTPAQKWIPRHNDDGTISLESVCCPGKFLDVRGAGVTDGTPLQIYPGNGTDAQKFYFNRVINKVYKPQEVRPFEIVPLVNTKSRVDVAGCSDELGTAVQIYKANQTPAQQWYVLDNGDGTWTILANLTGAKRVIDVKGAGK